MSQKKKGRRTLIIIYFVCWGILALLLFASRTISGFGDWYIRTIFPIWGNIYGRITGLFPFSVGEWLIGLQLCLCLVAICALFLRKIRAKYLRFFGWELLAVATIMTLNCFLLYSASGFDEKYILPQLKDRGEASAAEDSQEEPSSAKDSQEEPSLEELLRLYNKVAENCNRLSQEVSRDENNLISYNQEELRSYAVICMQELGKRYDQLAGYYSKPKPLLTSDFMCQQSMLGYYFPFSLEANYNTVAYVPNLPATMCHELSHLKGYIFENEANLIAYLACTESDDPFFQYSGYLSVLGYICSDLRKASKANSEAYQAACEEIGLVKLDSIVYEDDRFVLPEDWDRINANAWFKTETVEKAADAFVETNLKANGVAEGKLSYSYVVRLLILYERLQEK